MPTYFQTMSPASSASPPPPAPQPSALPPSNNPASEPSAAPQSTASSSSKHGVVKPQRKPLLRFEIRDLSLTGARSFLRLLHASTALEGAVDTVLTLLYSGLPAHCIPPTRSITLVLRSMDGVAYTTGLDIDEDHKEVHLSMTYVSHVPDTRLKEEILGVVVHEMVHCWQHNARGSAPGGLIEGIADWVRLKAGYAPPHWRRHADCDWDAGYERTGYFLEWLEEKHGSDIVPKINESLRDCKYEEDAFWHKCCGKSISKLWDEYKAHLAPHNGKDKQQETHEESEQHNKGKQAESAPDSESRDSTHDNSEHTAEDRGTPVDTRSPRIKARRGGNMHIPVRPPFS